MRTKRLPYEVKYYAPRGVTVTRYAERKTAAADYRYLVMREEQTGPRRNISFSLCGPRGIEEEWRHPDERTP